MSSTPNAFSSRCYAACVGPWSFFTRTLERKVEEWEKKKRERDPLKGTRALCHPWGRIKHTHVPIITPCWWVEAHLIPRVRVRVWSYVVRKDLMLNGRENQRDVSSCSRKCNDQKKVPSFIFGVQQKVICEVGRKERTPMGMNDDAFSLSLSRRKKDKREKQGQWDDLPRFPVWLQIWWWTKKTLSLWMSNS